MVAHGLLREGIELRPTAVLLSSNHIGWVALRTLLHEHYRVSILGDTASTERALELVARSRPQIILAACSAEVHQVALFLDGVRFTSPRSSVMLFGEGFTRELAAELMRLDIHALVTWPDATCERLLCAIDAVLEGLRVISPSVSRETATGADVHLSPTELQVLVALQESRTEEEIAAELGVGLRTVPARVSSLKVKLDAPTLFSLGARSKEMGLAGSGVDNPRAEMRIQILR